MYGKFTNKIRKTFRALTSSTHALKNVTKQRKACAVEVTQPCSSSQANSAPIRCLSTAPVHINGGNEPSHIQSDERVRRERRSDSDSSASWQTFFENDRFKNWLRVGLALRTAKDAVAPLVDRVLIDFHLRLRDKYGKLSNKQGGRSSLGGRPYLKDVLKLQRRAVSNGEVLRRSDVDKWLSDDGPWEIAKVFMPKGGREPTDVVTAKSFDVTGMFNLMTSCTLFDPYVSDVQQIRNQTMHNPRFEFTAEEMEGHFRGIIALMEDDLLKNSLEEFDGYSEAMQSIETIQNLDFDITAAVKSSFSILEEDLAHPSGNSNPPYPSAMWSSRELLRKLRMALSSETVNFTVDTEQLDEKLRDLEALLSEQQCLTEQKIDLVFRKADYLERKLEYVHQCLSSASPDEARRADDGMTPRSTKASRKRAKKRAKKERKRKESGKSSLFGRGSWTKIFSKRGSSWLAKSKYQSSESVSTSPRPMSVPSRKSPFSRMSPLSSLSDSGLGLFATTPPNMISMRSKSSSSVDDGKPTDFAAESNDKKVTGEGKLQSENARETDTENAPDPSASQDMSEAERNLMVPRKRTVSGSLIRAENIKKSLMLPFSSHASGKKSGKEAPVPKKQKKDDGHNSTKGSSQSAGGSSSDGHFQQILRKILAQQTPFQVAVYEDRKEDATFASSVRFRSKFAVRSLVPKSTADLAEGEAAVEALKRFGLEVTDRRNARTVLGQFCEAAVGVPPVYHSFAGSSCLYVGCVQVHSMFADWTNGDDDTDAEGNARKPTFGDDILIQVKYAGSADSGREAMEQNCAKLALAEANIVEPPVLNFKKALNELCLRDGGTLPIYESTTEFGDKQDDIQRTTTVTSFLREKVATVDHTKDDLSSVGFDLLADSFLSDDIVMASSSQPGYTQDQAEEAAARALLEKMGVVVGNTAAGVYREPYKCVLRDNVIHWGYNPPQFHTFQVKPQLGLGPVYFAVVSSKAFHKTMESLTAESEPGMTSLYDARESAARKALLMLGYPQTFYKTD